MSYVNLDICKEYNLEKIEGILRRHLSQSGVMDKITPGIKVALKLNLVAPMKPDTAGTTHPVVVEALCRILKELGAEVILGDSPGGPFNATYLKGVYHTCGLNEIAERTGAKLNSNCTQSDVSFPEGIIAKNITVTSWLLEADVIINCCKLKTHGMMGMSAAVKNMFGSIPGTMKPEYHFRFPKQADFANMLIDLQEYWKPKMILQVVDGIVGMEGNGPTAGTPRPIGVLMSGTDPYALDLVGGRIIGLEQADVLTMSEAYARGLSGNSADDVDLLFCEEGSTVTKPCKATKETLVDITIEDYELMDNKADLQFGGNTFTAKLRSKIFARFMSSKPVVEPKECIGCRKCEQICPAGAITMINCNKNAGNIPEIDRDKCIKCFCCQEFCPKGAMKVKRTAIARLLAH